MNTVKFLLKLSFVFWGLYLGAVVSQEPTEHDVANSFLQYKESSVYKQFLEKSHGTVFEKISPAICFARQYNPDGFSSMIVAETQRKIITYGFGVGGISTRKATPIEFNAAMAILKGVATHLNEIPASKPTTPHQSIVYKAITTFRTPPETLQQVTSWTQALDPIANVGTPNNLFIHAPAEVVKPCIEFNYSLYQHLLSPKPEFDVELTSLKKQFKGLKASLKPILENQVMKSFPKGMNMKAREIKDWIELRDYPQSRELLKAIDFRSNPTKHSISDEELAAFEAYAMGLHGKTLLTTEEKRKREVEKKLFEAFPYGMNPLKIKIKAMIDTLTPETREKLIEELFSPNRDSVHHLVSDEELTAFETYAMSLHGKPLLTKDEKHKRKAQKELFSGFSYGMYTGKFNIKKMIENDNRKGLAEELSKIDFSSQPKHSVSDEELDAYETYARELRKNSLLTEREKHKRESEKALFEALPQGMSDDERTLKTLIDKNDSSNKKEINQKIKELKGKTKREAFESYRQALTWE